MYMLRVSLKYQGHDLACILAPKEELDRIPLGGDTSRGHLMWDEEI